MVKYNGFMSFLAVADTSILRSRVSSVTMVLSRSASQTWTGYNTMGILRLIGFPGGGGRRQGGREEAGRRAGSGRREGREGRQAEGGRHGGMAGRRVARVARGVGWDCQGLYCQGPQGHEAPCEKARFIIIR